MSRYAFSKKGKLKDITKDILFHGTSIAFLIFISRFAKLYYVTWIPILWLGYNLFCRIFYVCALTFCIDEDGLNINTFLNVSTSTKWEDIKKIEITKHRSKITAIDIYAKNKDDGLRLWDDIINFEELAIEILNKAKNFGGIEIINRK